MWILNILAFNLLMVFILEMPIGWLLGAKNKRKAVTMMLSNVITNPAVVLGRLSLTLFLPQWENFGIILLEIAAVLTEGFIFSKYNVFEEKNPYIVSLSVNLFSFLCGEVIGLITKF